MTYGECLIEAETEDQAYQIAQNVDINDLFEETECYSLQDIEEVTEREKELLGDLPTLQQTKEGYKVKWLKKLYGFMY